MDEKPINLDAEIRERLLPIVEELEDRRETGLDNVLAISVALTKAIHAGVQIGVAWVSAQPQSVTCPACGNVGTLTASDIMWDEQVGPNVDLWTERFGDDAEEGD